MVSRRSTQSVTQRSTRQSELHMTRRPRRLVAPKTVDDAVGLSRKEERELKKALYASLQESRRARTPLPEEDNEASKEMPKLRKSTRHINPSSLHCARIHGSVHGSIPSASMDESSQDSVVSSVPSSHGSKKKVHAQRKFAQGCSLPSTPNNSPGKKAANASHSLLDRVPKTEDFLTFLCLRGSHLLPPNLDFFNFARDESALEEEINSRQRTPVTSEQGVTNDQTRESTPESSSSGSNVNEELMEFTTPLSTTSRLAAAVSMKAARASAGTPDTARGIVSLRQGLTRKRVPADAFKSVGRTQTRVKKDKRNASSNASPVRKILEGASKKLRKSQSSDMLRRPKKDEKQMRVRSREDRLKKRSREDPRRRQGSKKTEAKKPHRAASRPLPTKAKRRSSVRLKTLAKILGRKRPNYSLVASGYADMEEYEEEQKKKAAKSALTKAKAEARARASVRNAAAVAVRKRRVKEPEKMRTRSSSVTTKEPEDRHQGDREKDRHLGDRERTEEKRQGDRVEERRAGDRERTGAGPLKRSLSTSSTEKKEQNTLASVVETKRLKKEGGAGREGEGGGTRQPVARETVRKVLPATPPQPKKVTPKKVTPEKPSFASSSSPDPGLSHLEKVPTFYPTEDEFSDPISYIDSIREKAEWCGMCCIIPPQSWKMESKINEEIRFTTQVQHLHRLYSRWGISVEQTRAIVHHLSDITSNHNSLSTPQIGGVEVDLPQLYRMIRDLGGLQNIVDKKQWVKVADAMKIPKAAHDRVTRLYDVYCKFVLPYAMLSETEREQAQKDVHTHYELSSAEEDAIFKGKSMTLGTFSRISRNVQSMWFREDPTPEMVETTLWKIVQDCKSHVSVQCAHVNTRTQSTAFPMRRESPYYRHSWNLNNLPDNKKCILKCLGPVSGTTIPTLHVGMLFSASCWSTDPHRLPYVQYLHSGANTIWYCIPKSDAEKFHEAMRELCPTLIHNDPLWLSEDTAMVNPDHLKAKGVRVTRCVQQPRQFVVVFPDVHTATVCCGYNVSESVHYATTEWLSSSMEAAKALCVSREKELFSVDTLVCGLCQDSNDIDTLTAALPLLQSIVMREIEERRQLSAAGLKCERRLAVEDSPGMSSSVARKRSHDLAEDSACEVCYKICYLSMVLNEHDEQILCLEHGLRHVQRKRHVKAAKLFYRYTEEELTELVQMTKERLASLSANGNGLAKKRTLKKQDSRS
ncbi:protein Jumonji-like isoform X2 [Littorina saxatilis]|uniref:Protein Jumonji n=1 Tax=Littorina saxatilis TaxID=31220 RepID=A0AAN9GPA9_9CAEN